MKLPPGFSWEGDEENATGPMSLLLEDRQILHIRPQRSGWVVEITMVDPERPQPEVAVRSVAAGMRWSARWVNGRRERLQKLLEGRV